MISLFSIDVKYYIWILYIILKLNKKYLSLFEVLNVNVNISITKKRGRYGLAFFMYYSVVA